ncbi:hypothetical protein OAB00_00105 [Akkermansiaceae bacterium]|nr:hypothetical protein [Akkermansiaceae bacterium]
MKLLNILTATACALAPIGYAQTTLAEDHYEFDISSPYASVKVGDSFSLLSKLTMDHPYTSYYKMPGKFNLGVKLDWDTPEGVELKRVSFPVPKIKEGPSYYYKEVVWFISEFTTSTDLAAGSIELIQKSMVQPCTDEACLQPSRKSTPFSVTFGDTTAFTADGETKLKEAKKQAIIANPAEGVTVSADGDSLKISVTTSEAWNISDGIVFIPDSKDNFNEEISAVEAKKTDTGYEFTYPLPEDNEAADSINGIITSSKSQLTGNSKTLYVSSPITGALTAPIASSDAKKADEPKKKDADHEGIVWSEEDIAKHAELYDPEVPISHDNGVKGPTDDSAGGLAEKGILYIAGFAFIGGLLLNLMPCVFPVLGLKVMGFAQLSGNDPKKIKMHGLVFTAGVVASMWVLTGILLIIKQTTPISWGQQLGNPIFVGSIVILLFVLGLNMYGVFEMGTKLTSAGGDLQNKKGYSGSFFSGILTTLIATPCAGPFVGVAMSFALQQPSFQAIVLFTIFALGISSPYLVLSFAPKLINALPKPGAWMEVFKKAMAFPLFATAIFFLKSFSSQTGIDGTYRLAFALVLFAMAAWAYGTWGSPYMTKIKRLVWGIGFPVLVSIGAISLTYSGMKIKAPEKVSAYSEEGLNWYKWHPGLVEYLTSQEKVIWVDYTADW